MAAAEGEGRDGCCRVCADSGQGAQSVEVIGHVPAVLAVDQHGRRVQP